MKFIITIDYIEDGTTSTFWNVEDYYVDNKNMVINYENMEVNITITKNNKIKIEVQ